MIIQNRGNTGKLWKRGLRLGISGKVTLLVTVVIMLFLAVAVIGYTTSREISARMQKSRKLIDAGGKVTAIKAVEQEQQKLLSELSAGGVSRIDEVRDTVSRQRELINQTREDIDSVSGGVAILERMRGVTGRMGVLVEDDITAALATGDAVTLTRLSRELDDLNRQLDSQVNELDGMVKQSVVQWESGYDRFISASAMIQSAATVVATLLAIALGLFYARRLRKRLKSVSQGVSSLASGDMDTRIAVSGDDEVSELGVAFNSMAAAMATITRRLEQERNQIRSIHQGITDGIVVYDDKGKIISANPAAEAAMGMLERDLRGGAATGINEIDEIAGLGQLVTRDRMVRCWEEKACTHPDCPSFKSSDLQCWLQCGTYCYNEIQGTFKQKRDACERCEVYVRNGLRKVEFEKGGRTFTATISPILNDLGHEEGRMVVLHEITEIRKTEEMLRSRNDELMVLNEIASSLSQSMDEPDTILNEAMAGLARAVGASACFIATFRKGRENVCIRGTVGISPQTEAFMGLLPASPLRDLDVDEKTGLLDTDQVMKGWKAVGPLLKREGLKRPVILPIEIEGRISGMLAVADDQKEEYSNDDLRLIRACGLQFGVAINNTDLFRQLDKATKTWETTFDSMGDGILVLDPNRTIVMANGMMSEMLDMPVKNMIGRKCYEIVHGIDAPIDSCPFDEAMDRGAGGSVEIDEKKSGRTFRVSVNPIKDESGNVIGMVHVMSDITDKNRLRNQLIRSEKMVAVGQLVAGVAHELNNPLTGVMGYAQLLMRRYQDRDEETTRDLAAVISETERATRIVQNLLSFARKHKPQKNMVDVNAAVEDVVELREYELKVNDIKVAVELDRDLPLTMADMHQIQQVLLNVINNAAEALRDRKDGQIKVMTRHDDAFIRVTVSDNGAGIDPDDLPRVFDPFFTTRDVGQGTGLGLSVCYGIIEEHGGEITINSEPGKGASVSFSLPVVSAAAGDNAGPEEVRGAEAGSLRHVLLVDNEPAIVELLSDMLTMDGYGVDVADNCSLALKKLSQTTYDSVITDFSDARCGGDELYRRIREMDPELAANVIFILDETENGGKRRYLDQEGNLYLIKPFDLQNLRDTLRTVMKSHG
ncbi:blue-light-activated protein [bacterium BMS3Abin01]|nr:blue-light-activated protein [bacterium BMS3Abin01]